MIKPKLLIKHDGFLWKPTVNDIGATVIHGPYCNTCRIELAETGRPLGDPYDGPYESVAYCAKCKDETVLNNSFDEMRNAIVLTLASKELEDYEIIDINDLPSKERPPKSPKHN